eukprot:scaffold11454_cov99-Isochrysis_galbana.AAC.3
MLDLSEEPDEENIAICAKYFKEMAPMKLILEMEIGITGGDSSPACPQHNPGTSPPQLWAGVEDGVDNSDVARDKLYSQPEDTYKGEKPPTGNMPQQSPCVPQGPALPLGRRGLPSPRPYFRKAFLPFYL